MSFSIDFYSTDKTRALNEILRLNSSGAIPMEVAVFLATGVRNLRTDTYEHREDANGKYIGGPLQYVIHVKADGHLCSDNGNSYEVSTGTLLVRLEGPVV